MTRHVVLVLALLVASSASAQTSVPTTDGSRVLIEYTGPTQLSNDFMVMRIKIGNRSGRDRTWAFEFNALGGNSRVGRRSRFELEVDDGLDRHFEILVPLSGALDASRVQMVLFGYGVANAGQMQIVANTLSSRVAVSSNATMRTPEVRDYLTADASGDTNTLAFQAEALTGDWRVYSSLSVLWLAADEWKQADAAVRRALTEWVAAGGRLVLVEPGDTPARVPIERHGMGTIVTIPEGLTAEEANALQLAVPPAIDAAASVSWVVSLIDPIETPKGLLSFVLLGYLVLAAPVNLLVFSRGRKRMRLFWTMPAIALGASAVMVAVILLQDGVGGSGYRANFVYLQPDLNRELIVQEQVSKTGALLRQSFETEEPGPVVINGLATAHHPDSYQKHLELTSHGSRYTGDWFRSRSIQAQRLQWARSSRARIERVGFESGRPTILSSIEVPLEKLYFRDGSGRIWYGENVLPGRPVSLRSTSEPAYDQFLRDVSFRTAGPTIRAHTNVIRGLRGAFLASAASDGSDVALDTLTSIDWTDGPVLYAGHVKNDVWEAAR